MILAFEKYFVLDVSYFGTIFFGKFNCMIKFCLGRLFCLVLLLYGTFFGIIYIVMDDSNILGPLKLFGTFHIVWNNLSLGWLLFGTTIVWDDWFGGFIEFSLWLDDAVLRIIMRIIWPNPSIILNLIFLRIDESTKQKIRRPTYLTNRRRTKNSIKNYFGSKCPGE